MDTKILRDNLLEWINDALVQAGKDMMDLQNIVSDPKTKKIVDNALHQIGLQRRIE